jgi:hypothetical protein
LDLNDTLVSDAGLNALQGMKGLKYLGFNRTRVTHAGAKRLEQALPNLGISR